MLMGSVCENGFCKLREKCARFTARPNREYQDVRTFSIKEDGTCKMFFDKSRRGYMVKT